MGTNLLKSAMNNGLIMGVLFSVNFLLGLGNNVFMNLLTYVVMVLIIVATYYFTVRYRDVQNEGYISYGSAFSFILLIFFFGALISSIVKYIYFQFINPEYLVKLYEQSVMVLEEMNLGNLFTDENYKQMENMLKPAKFSLQYIWMNTLLGVFVGLIMAAVVKKEKSIFEQ